MKFWIWIWMILHHPEDYHGITYLCTMKILVYSWLGLVCSANIACLCKWSNVTCWDTGLGPGGWVREDPVMLHEMETRKLLLILPESQWWASLWCSSVRWWATHLLDELARASKEGWWGNYYSSCQWASLCVLRMRGFTAFLASHGHQPLTAETMGCLHLMDDDVFTWDRSDITNPCSRSSLRLLTGSWRYKYSLKISGN